MASTNVQRVTPTVDLVYSRDDGGWYFQRYLVGREATSQRTYPTREAAMWEWDAGKVEWNG